MSKMYSIGDLALTLTRALPQELTLTQAHTRVKKSWFFLGFSKKTLNFYKNSLLQQNLFKVR